MLDRVKTGIRDSLPRGLQVPLKYWFSKFRGDLEREMSLLPDLLSVNGRFVDVGANRGVYAYASARLCGHVELFEPNPHCAVVLRAFAESRPNTRVHNVALSDHQGSAIRQVPVDEAGIDHDSSATIEESPTCCSREYTVRLATLDSFHLSDVELIKIDVEGHESRVVHGASKTISSQMPALLIEIEQRHLRCPIADVFQQLIELGYDGFFMGTNGALQPLSEFNSKTHQAVANLGGIDGCYTNNFLFLHRMRLLSGEYRKLVEPIR